MPRRLFLIDGSSYVFRAYHAIPLLTSSKGLPTNAVFGFTNMVIKLLKDEKPSHVAVVFDAPGETFRDRMFAPYKANREEAPEELRPQFPLIKRAVKALNLTAVEVSDVEADDVIGTLALKAVKRGMNVVVVTGDKDFMQLVGPRLSVLDTMRRRRTDVAEIERRFGLSPSQLIDVMALMGDPVDNVPGVKGVGEKTATLLIQRFGSLDKLLNCIDEVAASGIRGAAKIAERLRAEADTARLSRELVTVKCDLPLDLDPEGFIYTGPDLPALLELCQELGFNSLARELQSSGARALIPQVRYERQGSLAAEAACRPEVAAEKPTAEALREAARAVRKAATCGISVAATSRPAMLAELEAVALGEPEGQTFYVAGGSEDIAAAIDWLGSGTRRTIAGEDLKRVVIILGRTGVELRGRLFDTSLASYLLDPSKPSHRLTDLAATYLGESPLALGEAEEVERSKALAASRLVEVMERKLGEVGASSLYHEVELPLVRVLVAMERNGIKVDQEVLSQLSVEFGERLDRQMEEIYEMAGERFNINSPAQLRQVLFDKLNISSRGVRKGKTGFSTDFDTLTKLAEVHPLPAKILDYRALAKLKSTYVDPLPAMINPATGRIHTSFNQTVTATGRLSSSEPNLQNIPIRTEEGRRIRTAFVAAEGNLLLGADYSQIELRILAHLSRDPTLIAAFQQGEDIHSRTAAEIFAVPAGEVDSEMRRHAKVINFGVIYGMGAHRLSRELGIPRKQAEAFIKSYFARYQGVSDYTRRVVEEARQLGYVTTILNRRRYLPELKSSDGGLRQFAERTAINTPVQGSAADLIKLAMVRLDKRIRRQKLQARMLLQVHDELVFEVAEKQIERVQRIVREEMEQVWELAVPLKVDAAWGRNWSEAH